MGSRNSKATDGMVFLVGVRRSGTHLLQRLLDCHPAIMAIPSETHLFSHGFNFLQERVQHGIATSPATGTVYMEREAFIRNCRSFCDAIFEGIAGALDPSARLILERTPMHVFHLDLISQIYPSAKFVHIVRDGRDVARSLSAQSWGPPTVAGAAAEWRDGIRAARGSGLPPSRYFEVRYEELLRDPMGMTVEIFRFLGLETDDATAEKVARESGVVDNADGGDPVPRMGKWRDHWGSGELRAFDREAGVLLKELGYPETRHKAWAPFLRKVARRVGRSGDGNSATEKSGTAPDAPPDASADAMQHVVDRFFAGLRNGADRAEIQMPTSPSMTVVIRDGNRWTGTGNEGIDKLREALSEADAVTSDCTDELVHAGPLCVVVRRDIEGGAIRSIVVVTLAGNEVTRVEMVSGVRCREEIVY